MKYRLANNGGESIGTVSLASSSTMTLSGPISAVSFGGVLELDAGATLLLPPQLSAELTFTFALTLNAGATLSLPTATSVSFGGSVSLGSYVVNEVFGKRLKHSPHPDNTLIGTGLQAGNFNSRAAWPALLEAALNGCLGGGAVHVVNHAERAAGTDAWVDRLAAGSVNLSRADVVLIEEASNDAEAYAAVAAGGARGSFGGEPTAAGFTEVLLHQLRRLPRQPYCLWLTAAWRDFEYARARRAEGEHLWILRQYQVPHLSVLSAFAPYEGSQPVARFLRSVYFADCCHPTRTGHKIVAD